MSSPYFLEGSHSFKVCKDYGDWTIGHGHCSIKFSDLIPSLTPERLKVLDHVDIAWLGCDFKKQIEENCLCCNGERYKKCDIKYPGIIVQDIPNPFWKKYTLIDGKHRMQKMRANGITQSPFYIFKFPEIKKFLTKN